MPSRVTGLFLLMRRMESVGPSAAYADHRAEWPFNQSCFGNGWPVRIEGDIPKPDKCRRTREE